MEVSIIGSRLRDIVKEFSPCWKYCSNKRGVLLIGGPITESLQYYLLCQYQIHCFPFRTKSDSYYLVISTYAYPC